jgi:hypothetical protein
MMFMAWVLGLDLGQAANCTALAALNRTSGGDYQIRHLERFALGTSYLTIVAQTVELVAKPPLSGCSLAVDQTGVGLAVMNLLTSAKPRAFLVPITITCGHLAVPDGRQGYHVPKKELVSVMQVVLQAHRLKISPKLPLADDLMRELQNFRVKITHAANETFGAWREGQHDDMVFAVAMAGWVGEILGAKPKRLDRPLNCWPKTPIGGRAEDQGLLSYKQALIRRLCREDEF